MVLPITTRTKRFIKWASQSRTGNRAYETLRLICPSMSTAVDFEFILRRWLIGFFIFFTWFRLDTTCGFPCYLQINILISGAPVTNWDGYWWNSFCNGQRRRHTRNSAVKKKIVSSSPISHYSPFIPPCCTVLFVTSLQSVGQSVSQSALPALLWGRSQMVK